MFTHDFQYIDHMLHTFLPSFNINELEKCETHAQRVNLILAHEWKNKFKETIIVKSAKSDARSIEKREAGNLLFRDKKYYEALQTYTSSIAWAESKVVASLAYGNRSAVLAKFGFYEECLTDIDRAFKHEYPEESNSKLLRRQKEVRELLLQKNRKEVPKTEIVVGRNSLIQSATNAVKIENDEKYGRHIVAARDIKIGELLVVEESYTVGLFKDFLIRCHQCVSLCYNLIPCDSCTQAMYCSQLCKEKAYQSYHKYECGILDHMSEYFLSRIIILKITLTAKSESKAEEKKSVYRSDRFDEISQLLTHVDQYPPDIMLKLYFMTAMIFILLKEKTTLFKDFDDYEETFKESFLLNVLRLRANGIPISRQQVIDNSVDGEEYAVGLYSLSSLFNHSCYPNTFFYHEGSKIIVRALATIKKGEQCFISYGPVYHEDPKPFRTIDVQNKFFFTCECRACEENWPAIGELCDTVSCISDMGSQEDQFSLQVNQQILATIENRAPSVEINFLRRILVEQYSGHETLPQAL